MGAQRPLNYALFKIKPYPSPRDMIMHHSAFPDCFTGLSPLDQVLTTRQQLADNIRARNNSLFRLYEALQKQKKLN